MIKNINLVIYIIKLKINKVFIFYFNKFNLFDISKNNGAKVEIKHQKELKSCPYVLNLLIINVANIKPNIAIPFILFFKNKNGKNRNML